MRIYLPASYDHADLAGGDLLTTWTAFLLIQKAQAKT